MERYSVSERASQEVAKKIISEEGQDKEQEKPTELLSDRKTLISTPVSVPKAENNQASFPTQEPGNEAENNQATNAVECVKLLEEEDEEEEPPEISEQRELIPNVSPSTEKCSERVTFLDEEETEDNKMSGNTGGTHKVALKKELTLLNGVAFVIGQIIGSGIFITPRIILGHTHSVFLSLVIWVVGGVVSLCGALCYCELGTFVKKSGGEYTYLKEAYSFKQRSPVLEFTGSLLAFLYTWSSTVIMRPTGFAVITMAVGKYFGSVFYIDSEVPIYVIKVLAVCVMMILTVVNCYSVRWSARLMTVLSFTKLLSCIFIIALGGWELVRNRCFPLDACGVEDEPIDIVQSTKSASDIALALYAVLLAYDGWNVLNYSVEEQENVEKNLPRAIWISLPIVAISYILVSIAFFAAVSSDQILNGGPIALEFGEAMLGKSGAVLISMLVALSAFGAANGSLFVSSRVVFTSARDGHLPEALSGVHTRFNTPVPATLSCIPLAIVFIIVGDFESLIDGMSAGSWVFYALTFAGVLVMRVTHRKDPRPYRVLVLLPVLMVVVSLFLIILPTQQKPLPSLLAFTGIALGVPVYVLFVMESPWRLRPKALDAVSKRLTRWSEEWLQCESSRES